MTDTEVLIIGAGVSGIACASLLGDRDYLICEALEEAGGYCRTVSRGGFVWDYSGHYFHFRHADVERMIRERMAAGQLRSVTKVSKIYYKGRMIDHPFQKNIHQLPRMEFMDCLRDLVCRKSSVPRNFEEMLYSHYGSAIADKFLIPYSQKVYCTALSRLDMTAMSRFFPTASVEDIVRNVRVADNRAYNSQFLYPEGGAIQYINALKRDVREDCILLSEPVVGVDVKNHRVVTPKREIRYRYLINTSPLNRFLSLIDISYDPSIYTYSKVLVFNLGFDSKGIRDVHWLYFHQPDICFYRVGYYDNICEGDRMSLYVEIGLFENADVSSELIMKYREEALRDLIRVGIITSQRLIAEHHVILDPAYVHITREAIADVAQRKHELAQYGVYSIGRYGSWTYCSIEDNIVEARSLISTLGLNCM